MKTELTVQQNSKIFNTLWIKIILLHTNQTGQGGIMFMEAMVKTIKSVIKKIIKIFKNNKFENC
jgi:hypothetical protein